MQLNFVVGSEKPDLLKQGIDIAIHSEPLADSALVQKPLATRRWVIAAAPSYLQRRGRPRTPDDLADHDLLTFSIRPNWNEWRFHDGGRLRTLRAAGKLNANQAELLRELALQGAGIVRLADFNVRADLASGRLVALLEDWVDPRGETMYLFRASGRPESARIRAFTEFIARYLRAGFTPP